MKETTKQLLKGYAKLSGEKKVQLSFGLSKLVRRIKKDGGHNVKLRYGT